MTTRATWGTSIPRAATSVATSISALPVRNFDIDCSRRLCDMSPSIATTSIPSLRRSRATSLVRYFVEQNTMVCPVLFSPIKSSRCPIFSRSFMTRNDWSIPSPLRSSASSRNCFGLRR